MLRVGIAGIGFMGWIHWLAYHRQAGTEVVAVATRDPKKQQGDWTSIQGNFGPPGEQVDLSGVQVHDSLESMIANSEIDLLDICLPPHLHVEACLAGLESGKHVFCEKPLALNDADCSKLAEAARGSERQLMVGHVLPFFPEYEFARQAIAGGDYGRLLGGHFKRVVSDPTWIADFYDPKTVGGPLIDLHVHDAHLIRMLFGMPLEVNCAARFRDGVVRYADTLFRYGDDKVVSASSGTIDQQGRPFHHAFEIHLERATLHFEFAAFADEAESMPLKVLLHDGSVLRPSLPAGSDIAGFEAEIAEVVRSIESGQPSPILDASLAGDAIRLCELQAQSAERRQPVLVD